MEKILLICLCFSSCDRNASLPIMFWNVENLMFPTDDPHTEDAPYIYNDWIGYTEKAYLHKLENLASIINAVSPSVLALAEVENLTVLKDLRSQLFHSDSWSILHRDSPDRRGIDTALLYRSDILNVTASDWLRTHLGENLTTREILKAEFLWKDYRILLFVLHWPSRYGRNNGTDLRLKAAEQLADNIKQSISEELDCILLMGDFNAEIGDTSLTRLLSSLETARIASDWQLSYRKRSQNFKSYWYKGEWKHYDHILTLLKPDRKLMISPSAIYSEWRMLQLEEDALKPFRFFSGRKIIGGYSDHLPVSSVLSTAENSSLR